MNIYLEVYGCTANKSDASIVSGILRKHHHTFVSDPEKADAVLLLTCTVIDTTEQRMISRMKAYKKLGKKTIIGGCMAAVQQQIIHSILPDALLLPPDKLAQIHTLLTGTTSECVTQQRGDLPKHYPAHQAPITIAEGCTNNCSYCITRHARGPLQSYPEEEILQDIKNALQQGCTELLLTAQDTAAYGQDRQTNLGRLLKKIHTLPDTFRLRVGMMNPASAYNILDDLITGYQDPRIYKFIHLPVQSADNQMLQKMNRTYTLEQFKHIITHFRKAYQDSTLSTDVIVGFPGETEQQFKHTQTLLSEIKPDITNITRFSARPLTTAKKMPDRLKTETVKQRSKILTQHCTAIAEQNNQRFHHKTCKVFITRHIDKHTSFGRMNNYKPVHINKTLQTGKEYTVLITHSSPTHLYGKLI